MQQVPTWVPSLARGRLPWGRILRLCPSPVFTGYPLCTDAALVTGDPWSPGCSGSTRGPDGGMWPSLERRTVSTAGTDRDPCVILGRGSSSRKQGVGDTEC